MTNGEYIAAIRKYDAIIMIASVGIGFFCGVFIGMVLL